MEVREAAEGQREGVGQEAEVHRIVGLDIPRAVEARVAIERTADRERRDQERVVVPFLVVQGRDVQMALVGKGERELETRDDVALGRTNIVVLGVGVATDLKRHVGERTPAEGLRMEQLVQAEGAAEQAVDLGRAGRVRTARARAKARRGGVERAGLQQVDGEEVGAVTPDVEVGEVEDRLAELAVAAKEIARIRGGELIGQADRIVVHEEERRDRRRGRRRLRVGKVGGERRDHGSDDEGRRGQQFEFHFMPLGCEPGAISGFHSHGRILLIHTLGTKVKEKSQTTQKRQTANGLRNFRPKDRQWESLVAHDADLQHLSR